MKRSWSEAAELLADRVHQGGDELLVEAEPGAGGLEELGQGARAAERQGAAVVGHGPGAVESGSAARSASAPSCAIPYSM